MTTQRKIKEPVKLRRRRLENGQESLYLDIYTDGLRRYEFLKMYLIPEVTPADRSRNTNTLQAANAIKAQRILEITNHKAGVIDATAGRKITIGAFISAFISKKERQGSKTKNLRIFAKNLKKWRLDGVKLAAIDKEYCLRLIDAIRRTEWTEATKYEVQTTFSAIFNEAKRSKLIPHNPMNEIPAQEKIRPADSTREFLTVEEVGRLIETPCRYERTKRAFLFSCFTGLRISDICALRWTNIHQETERPYLRLKVAKTRRDIVIPLSVEALRWLSDRPTNPETLVFPHMAKGNINSRLKVWAADAGITAKNVTFHVARHTFATTLITLGADLYTVSKLLGHSNISMTQIYAKIIDQKKADAVDLFSGHFS